MEGPGPQRQPSAATAFERAIAAKPRLRGVSHQYAFFVSTVAGAV